MRASTIQAGVALYSALAYDEGEAAFKKGTPEYAVMDALIMNDDIAGEIDRRQTNQPGTLRRGWTFDWSKIPGVVSEDE